MTKQPDQTGKMMYNGIINVYKDAGFTSADVVAKLRGIAKQKKIGHTGTLDPDATGVLPVCLGRATKVAGMLTDARKQYECVMLLGVVTDTQDIGGTVLETCTPEAIPEQEAVTEAVLSFQGEQMQVPPMYSALKKDGKRLYELAREGKVVQRDPRPVHFYEIRILEMELPRVRFLVTCSRGTYIRTLCHDIGARLGCGACMERLIRTQAGSFRLEDALHLEELQQLADAGNLSECITPVDSLFSDCPAIQALPEADRLLHNGNKVPDELLAPASEERMITADQSGPEEIFSAQKNGFRSGARVRVYDSSGRFIGLFTRRKGYLKPETIFYAGS